MTHIVLFNYVPNGKVSLPPDVAVVLATKSLECIGNALEEVIGLKKEDMVMYPAELGPRITLPGHDPLPQLEIIVCIVKYKSGTEWKGSSQLADGSHEPRPTAFVARAIQYICDELIKLGYSELSFDLRLEIIPGYYMDARKTMARIKSGN